MKKMVLTGLVGALLAGVALVAARDAPTVPGGEKEHEWLQQFVDEWESEAEVFLEPGKPPLTWKGKDRTRALGGFWIVSEGTTTFLDQPMTSIRTLGFDPLKKKLVCSQVSSFSSHLWKFEGNVDAAGKVLTLEADGPAPQVPGKLVKWRDVIEWKSKDHSLFTNSVQGEDGKWVTVATVKTRRKR